MIHIAGKNPPYGKEEEVKLKSTRRVIILHNITQLMRYVHLMIMGLGEV